MRRLLAHYADVGRFNRRVWRTVLMATYTSLNEAMVANDGLAEAELRYQLLAEAFEDEPKLRSQLNPALERAKAEILQLRALKPKTETGQQGQQTAGTVVAFDAERFRKSG